MICTSDYQTPRTLDPRAFQLEMGEYERERKRQSVAAKKNEAQKLRLQKNLERDLK
jgi:hypothetical protein